jgi:hypothetical protein
MVSEWKILGRIGEELFCWRDFLSVLFLLYGYRDRAGRRKAVLKGW